MSRPFVITVSSDEEEDEDDVQVLAFHEATQQLIQQAPPKVVKKLCDAECPICFDSVKNATMTFCGHVYCLECLQKSIAASSARGQTKGKKGVGLCPMCRKQVAFKEAIVLRLKKGNKVAPPPEKVQNESSESNQNGSREESSDDDFRSFSKGLSEGSDNEDLINEEDFEGLF